LKLTAITPSGRAIQLVGDDFDLPPKQIGSVVLPGTYSPNRKDYRAEVGLRVKKAKLGPRASRRDPTPRQQQWHETSHAVEEDPDLRDRLKAAEQADRVERELRELERRVDHRNATLAREFDGVLAILEERGLADLETWRLTEGGEMLARVFHESDLLVTETIRKGLLDGIDDATMAGLVSTFVYEHRSPDEPPMPWFPDSDIRRRWRSIEQLSQELAHAETVHGLAPHRPPDPTFFAIAYAWIAGEGFAEVVADEELTGGDFVRNVKQLIDVLRQVAIVAPDPSTRSVARRAAEAAFRGVVADASAIEPA
jgi:ATP-dependent RNA helicase HelY